MEFLGISGWEILVILIVALLVLGPNRLPGIARTLGRAVRAIRKASADLTTAVTREMEATENKPPPSQPKEESKAETGEAPPAISKPSPLGQDDQPTKSGGASAVK